MKTLFTSTKNIKAMLLMFLLLAMKNLPAQTSSVKQPPIPPVTYMVGHGGIRHDIFMGGGITNSLGKRMSDSAFLGNGFNINEGFYAGLFGNEKTSGGIVANVDYYNLDAANGLSSVQGKYKVIDGATTGAQYMGETPRAISFAFMVGPKAVFNFNKVYLTPALLLGYQTIKRDAFTIVDSVYQNNNPANKIYVPALSSDILKTGGFVVKPQLKVGYRISPEWNVWAGYNVTLGPKMENTYNTFVPSGEPDSSGAYFIDQFFGGSTVKHTSNVSWSTGSVTVGVTYRFGNGGRGKLNLYRGDGLGKAAPSSASPVIIPIKTPYLHLPSPTEVPNGDNNWCGILSFLNITVSGNTVVYSNCDRWSGTLCTIAWFPCSSSGGTGLQGRSASITVPSIKNFSGDGYLPVKIKLNDVPKDEKVTEIVVDNFTPFQGDLPDGNIKHAVILPGNYPIDKNHEAVVQIHFIQNPNTIDPEPLNDENGPTTGWCTVKRYRDQNCAGGGLRWCGEYTLLRCGGMVKEWGVIAYTPYRMANPNNSQNDSISIVQFASRSLEQLDSLGQGIAKSWGKAFQIEKYEGNNFMKFTPLTDKDKEILIFPIYNSTPNNFLINDGYICMATNCNCVGDCYCVTSSAHPQNGKCVKGRKVSIGFGDDWTYYYQ